MTNTSVNSIQNIEIQGFKGEIDLSYAQRVLYSTDASAYREIPYGVAYPKDNNDIRLLIRYANEHKLPLIPRTAGTSLAGQVCGRGFDCRCF